MDQQYKDFLEKIVALDLEIHPAQDRIMAIGAYAPGHDRGLTLRPGRDPSRALQELDGFCRGCDFILGHNILDHDLLFLSKQAPDLNLLNLVPLDTLYLSPLTFPENPYHRLVKDYKLVKQSLNDPLADARLALDLFQDQWLALQAMNSSLALAYGGLLKRGLPHSGYDQLIGELTGQALPGQHRIQAVWLAETAGRVCRLRAGQAFETFARDPEQVAGLAYALAWLRVAGGNSVLPPWVRHRFVHLAPLLDQLRSVPCQDPGCTYCQEQHDLETSLENHFGFSSFLPVKDEDPPLQKEIVTALLNHESCLTVMPTGAGKSLCYQLPGLIKAEQRNGLTIIISPLQSLMKDQVDGLKTRGIPNVGAVNGLLTMLERSQVLEGIRLGDIDLVWISPEQMRNGSVKAVLRQREIGLVVVDEAHCISKWGHDFRPDYLYIGRFLKEMVPESMELPQVACFTATAKPDVVREIQDYFRAEMGFELLLFQGGHDRENLMFEVIRTEAAEKEETIHSILGAVFADQKTAGGAIVFAATRRQAESLCQGLGARGWVADFFHGARTPEDKHRVQERFLTGQLRIIVATNAFGMGVDKPDVRVVIHAHVPGSLESYLQEAGRAGRDRKPARCFLLFDPEDMETQFLLSTMGRLEWRDVSGVFTGLKQLAARHPDQEVVLTSGELLRTEEIQDQNLEDLSLADSLYDQKVKTVLAWLEKSGKIQRGDNRTRVVQGRIVSRTLGEAKQKIQTLSLSFRERQKWFKVLKSLFALDPKEMINTDHLCLQTGLEPKDILAVLQGMRKAGVISHDLQMTAFVHTGVQQDSRTIMSRYLQLEESLLKCMEEQEPDAGPDHPGLANPRLLAQALKDRGLQQARPDQILQVFELLTRERLLRQARLSMNLYKLFFRFDWAEIRDQIEQRARVCKVLLTTLFTKLPPETRGRDRLVSFTSGELSTGLQSDLSTIGLSDHKRWIEQGLLALHSMRAIYLQNGLSVFRRAMTIQLTAHPEERFTSQEFTPLHEFFQEKIVQVHIMGRYAHLGLETVKKSLLMVREYFQKQRESFLQSYFKGEEKLLQLPTTLESYHRIVSELHNQVQEQAVTSGRNRNLLILAGPGSGKTRVIVHRIAYLVRIKRISPARILALAFNRSAVTQLKTRLKQLIGKDASPVKVHTYHSLAMSLTGRSLAGHRQDFDSSALFTDLLEEAIRLLEEETGAHREFCHWRDRLLAGVRYILVDEYQDINELEYRFLSLLAGRNEMETGHKPLLMAVGDDDQNIYAWDGANVRFIRRFAKDYQSRIIYLSTNYRSRPGIIRSANTLIANNQDRMKTEHPTIPGPAWRNQAQSPGVSLIHCPDQARVFKAALSTVQDLLAEKKDLAPGDICLLCRTNREITPLQVLARQLGHKTNAIRTRGFSLTRTREFRIFLNLLGHCLDRSVSGQTLVQLFEELQADSGFRKDNPWMLQFLRAVDHYVAETGGARLPLTHFQDFVFDLARETRQSLGFFQDSLPISTMHGVKGLEFPVVIIVGQPLPTASLEEERRLYYVAMTRAKERLYCLTRDDGWNPFAAEIKKDEQVALQRSNPELTPDEELACRTELWELGLSDLVISFPAYPSVMHQAQAALCRMEPGDWQELDILEQGESLFITCRQKPVARLSARGKEIYRHKLSQGYRVQRVIFLASVLRHKQDQDRASALEAVDSWYTGLFQILLDTSNQAAVRENRVLT